MRKQLLSLALFLCIGISSAQDSSDSIRFCNVANWETTVNKDGIVVRELKSKLNDQATSLFNSTQHIYVMEIDGSHYRLGLAQDSEKQRTSALLKSRRAVAAINGGFFKVDKEVGNNAIANDFLKINGRIASPYPTTGWGTAAIGFSDCSIGFTMWNKQMDTDTISGWSVQYPDVLVAGPMLILNGEIIHNEDVQHPRTAIGTGKDGKIIIVVVDGRRVRASGATFEQLAQIGKWLELDNMINLDGGGSSTMFYGSRLINFPSDGFGIVPFERKVSNAVLVLAK